MNPYPTVFFTADERPPAKKGSKSCWGTKEANYVFKLREKAREVRTNAGLDDCFHGPVKLELVVYAPNIRNRKNAPDYISDLDTLIAGVLESLQPAPNNPGRKRDVIISERDDIGPEIPCCLRTMPKG